MNCLIDSAINLHAKKGLDAEVVKRYIKMKYRINIDIEAIRTRFKNLKQPTWDVA